MGLAPKLISDNALLSAEEASQSLPFEAVRENNCSAMKNYLESLPKKERLQALQTINNDGDMFIHCATREANLQMVELLLEYGTPPDAQNTHGQTALHCVSMPGLSMMNGREAVALYLIQENIPLDIQDSKKQTALHYAVASKNVILVQQLLAAGANPGLSNSHGHTSLHLAILRGYEDTEIHKTIRTVRRGLPHYETEATEAIVSMLTESTIVINKRDENGHTALHLAARILDVSLMKQLIKKGAHCQIPDHTGVTAEMILTEKYEARANNMRAVKKRYCFANFNRIRQSIKRINCLIDGIEWLRGIRTDHNGQTLIHILANDGDEEGLKMAIKNGAILDIPNDLKQTPLHIAATKGYNGIVSLLLIYTDTIPVDSNGQTPLHCAIKSGNFDVATTLLTNMPEMGFKEDVYNNTPINMLINIAYTLRDDLTQEDIVIVEEAITMTTHEPTKIQGAHILLEIIRHIPKQSLAVCENET